MGQSPSWETNRLSGTQGIPRLLWNLKVHCSAPKNLPLIPIMHYLNPLQTSHPASWRFTLIFSSCLYLGLPSTYFPSFPEQNSVPVPPTCATVHAHLIFLNLIILTISGEKWKIRSASLHNFLQPPVPFSLFGPKYSLQRPVFKHT
jgi:hypothetical protein